MRRFFAIVVWLIVTSHAAFAQSAVVLSENAANLNRYGQTLEGAQRQNVLGDVRRILDRVLVEYPNSQEAATIRGGGQLGTLNVAALDAELAGKPVAQPIQPPIGDQQPLFSGRPIEGESPVLAAPFDPKARMKAVQTALNERGCKTGTPDGVSGRKTVRGYETFLKEKNLDKGLYPIDGDAFWQVLMGSEGIVCESMPVVPVNARTMPGQWTYTSTCGSKSKLPGQKINGVLTLQATSGNSFRGNLVNSQGLRARVSGRLSGRRVALTANFGFLFGKVNASGTVSDEAYVVYGRDSNGCRFTARKR